MRLRITQWSSRYVGPERDAGHLHGVAGAFRRGDRAHERLVAVADVAVDHVEVALVDRHVDRLTDRPAAVVEVRRLVGQLHEVAEVLDRAVAPAAVEVAHERRAVVRREDRVRAADLDAVRLVAGELGELARRARLDDPAAHAAREADALAVDVGAGLADQAQGVRVATELDPDLLEDRVGVVLDERQALLVEHLERGEGPGQERGPLHVRVQPRGASSVPATAASGRRRLGHRSSPVLGVPVVVVVGVALAAAVAPLVGGGARLAGRHRGRRSPVGRAASRPARDSGSRRSDAGSPWPR